MQKITLGLLSLVLLGGGCIIASTTTNTDWQLSFALPEGWIVTEGCMLDDEHVGCGRNIDSGTIPTLDTDVDAEAMSINLQNTEKLPLFGGIAPQEGSEDLYSQEEVAVIQVSILDPDEPYGPAAGGSLGSEDLGNGFQKFLICDLEQNPECEIYGGWAYQYLFVAPSGDRYGFTVVSVGVDHDEIEQIILSAAE
jgi:hypothetical protein